MNQEMSKQPVEKSSQTHKEISSRQNSVLSTVCTLMGELLPIAPSEIDVTMPLLEMGADSLVITQAIRRIENHFGLTFTIRQIFEELNTLEALASYIEQQLPEENDSASAQSPLTQSVADRNNLLIPETQEIAKTASDTVLERILSQQIQAMSQQTQALSQQTQAMSQLMSQQLDVLHGLKKGTTTAQQETKLKSDSSPVETINKPLETSQKVDSRAVENQHSPLPPWRATEIRAKGLTRQQQQHLEALIARYTQKTPQSKKLIQHYRPVLADSRASAGFRLSTKEMLYPIVGKRAQGSKTWDIDGNEYIDITMGFGVNLFGHQPTFITEALEKQLADNHTQLGLQTPLAGEVAQLICELTGMERVTFCNTGTEAVMTALRLARTATNRSKIVQFAMSYHGHFDGVLGEAHPESENISAMPMAPGVTPNTVADTWVLDYGKPQSLELIRAHADELAGVLVEPVQSRRPDLQPKAFLQQLRQLTLELNIPLIFDEMITGFRIHPGGAQAWFDVRADIATYGKIVGGGMPIGIVAGKAKYMDGIDGGFWNYGDASYPQANTTFFAGTFGKHPLAMATALAVLQQIKQQGPALQERLNQRTTYLVESLNDYFETQEMSIRLVHFASLFRFTYSGNLDLLYYHLLEKGIYVWEGRNCFLSTAHTDEDIEYIIKAVKESVDELRQGGFLPPPPTPPKKANKELTLPAIELKTESSVTEKTHQFPLTEAQKQLWFLTQMGDEGSLAYNVHLSLQLRGHFNLVAMRQAVQQVVNRHEALRTVMSSEGDFQQCLSSLSIEVPIVDLSGHSAPECEDQLTAFLKQESCQPFNLTQGPLIRINVVKLEEERHLLVLTAHHIVTDGLSMDIMVQEIGTFYSAICQGTTCQLEPPLQFREYIQWQIQQSQTMATHETYWLNQFSDSIPVLNLPTDHPYPPIRSYQGNRQTVRLPTKLCYNLKTLSQKQGCTLFMTFLAAYTIWLYRVTGQNDILVGIPVAGRNLEGSDNLVGYCTHLLPIQTHIGGTEIFLDYLKTMRGILLEAYEHQDYPFASLINRLNLQRDTSHTPLVSTTFNLDKPSEPPKLFGLEVEWFSQPRYFTAFDISINLTDIGEEIVLDCDYNTDLFNATTIERFVGHLQVLLEGIVSHPEHSLSQLPVLTELEIQQLQAWNDTATDYPSDKTIVDLFEQQVSKTPSNIAVVFENQQLTYQQLNQKSNQLAHHLLALKTQIGIKQDNPFIAIAVERSLEMVIGLLGILKAGGAYVPIDPSYPAARIAYMLEDSRASLLLTQRKAQLPIQEGMVVYLDEVELDEQPLENPLVLRKASDLAYVIYTSGSTGQPKGVMVEHSALNNFIHSSINAYLIANDDKILQFASLSFDAATEEIYPALLKGATLILRTEEMLGTTETFLLRCDEQKLTVLDLPTAYWHHWLAELPILKKYWPESIRLVLIGGEAVSGEDLRQWFSNFGHFPTLFNTYGPTETTVVATHFPFTSDNVNDIITVPIGQPIANTRIYILDQKHQPQPPGIPGELCIAGAGLARGYLKRPELTSEKFIEVELFGKTERIYKTGDLARWRPDGNLEYLGRIDLQVKLRGFRIELGEIEAVLRQHEAVIDAVVTLFEADDNKRLVAYITTNSETNLVDELKNQLKASLPDYMIPSHFMVLDKLPLTPNGKIDRNALPAPDSNTLTENTLPRDTLELQLLSIWETVLDIHPLSIHDNFFELGGHSLLAVKLMSHIQQQYGVQLPMSVLFQSPTVAMLAQQLHQNTVPLFTNLVPIQTNGEKIPVYCLPGAIGSVMYLYPLASSLGQQQPFYALQTPGLNGEETIPETIEALALYHINALRKQQPQGPYQLLGHSFGGRVAFEMAYQLEQQGETIALLGILDANAPNPEQVRYEIEDTDYQWLYQLALEFEELTGLDFGLSLDKLQATDIASAYTHVLDTFKYHQLVFASDATVNELKNWVRVYRTTVNAFMCYQRSDKISCPIWLFRASEHSIGTNAEQNFEDKRPVGGWDKYTLASTEEFLVPGTHFTMMTIPHVQTLATAIQQIMNRGEKSHAH
jgi:amino acid adenylation domain-containing protein